MKINYKEQFTKNVLTQGRKFVRNGALHNAYREGDTYYAYILDNIDDKVSVKIQNNQFIEGHCTCDDYETNKECPHMVALIYYLEHNYRLGDKDNFLSNDPKDIINGYNEKISSIVSINSDCYCRIDNEFRFEKQIQYVIDDLKKMIKSKQYEVPYEISKSIIDMLIRTSYLYNTGFIVKCLDVINRILNKAIKNNDKIIEAIYKDLYKEIDSFKYYYYDVKFNELVDFYIEHSLHIEEIIKVLNNNIEKEMSYDLDKTIWYIKTLLKIYDDEQKQEFIEKHSDDGTFILALATISERQENNMEAISILKNSLLNEETSQKDKLGLKLAMLYQKEEMLEEQKDMLFLVLYQYDRGNLEAYHSIKKLYATEWNTIRKEIISNIEKKGFCKNLLDIFVEENMYAKLFDNLTFQDFDTIQKYRNHLPTNYSDKILDLYCNQARFLASTTTNEEDYKLLGKILKIISKVNKEKYNTLFKELDKKVFVNNPKMKEKALDVVNSFWY